MLAAKLDGHIKRALEGGTIRHLEKDGRMLIFALTNGERWAVALADPATGEGIPSEPILASVRDKHDVIGAALDASARMISGGVAADGHLNRILAGKTIEQLGRDGQTLLVTTTEGAVIGIGFLANDPAMIGKGEPCLVKVDVQIAVPGVSIAGMSAQL